MGAGYATVRTAEGTLKGFFAREVPSNRILFMLVKYENQLLECFLMKDIDPGLSFLLFSSRFLGIGVIWLYLCSSSG